MLVEVNKFEQGKALAASVNFVMDEAREEVRHVRVDDTSTTSFFFCKDEGYVEPVK